MKISFVIPAYNEEAYLHTSLSALFYEISRYRDVVDVEVIVVDNASTDNTASVAASFPSVRIVAEPEKGVARARQAGFLAADGDIVAYIDADTKITKDWIVVMLAEFAADPKLVALSGLCVFYDLPPFWRRLAGPYQGLIGWVTDLVTGELVFGGNFAARREAMQVVGGFDTSITFYGEDQNIVQRLKKVGKYKFTWKLVAETSARRFNKEGVLSTVGTYAANFISSALLKRPVIKDYEDIR